MSEVTSLGVTFTEETVGNFQLIIQQSVYQIIPLIDKSGKQNGWIRADDIAGIDPNAKPEIIHQYRAFAYEIGNPEHDSVANLAWLGQFGVIVGSFTSSSEKITTRKAKNKLNILQKAFEVRDQLVSMANDRLDTYHEIPFNVAIGDVVWVWAFGRSRKGIVVGTAGNRFHVGYVTPSNTHEVKYKTVHLPQILKSKAVTP